MVGDKAICSDLNYQDMALTLPSISGLGVGEELNQRELASIGNYSHDVRFHDVLNEQRAIHAPLPSIRHLLRNGMQTQRQIASCRWPNDNGHFLQFSQHNNVATTSKTNPRCGGDGEVRLREDARADARQVLEGAINDGDSPYVAVQQRGRESSQPREVPNLLPISGTNMNRRCSSSTSITEVNSVRSCGKTSLMQPLNPNLHAFALPSLERQQFQRRSSGSAVEPTVRLSGATTHSTSHNRRHSHHQHHFPVNQPTPTHDHSGPGSPQRLAPYLTNSQRRQVLHDDGFQGQNGNHDSSSCSFRHRKTNSAITHRGTSMDPDKMAVISFPAGFASDGIASGYCQVKATYNDPCLYSSSHILPSVDVSPMSSAPISQSNSSVASPQAGVINSDYTHSPPTTTRSTGSILSGSIETVSSSNPAVTELHSTSKSPRSSEGVEIRCVEFSEQPKVQGFFICKCCPKRPQMFATSSELKAHETERRFQCSLCHQRFKSKSTATRHHLSWHVRRDSWSCSALSRYKQAIFPSPRFPDECDECGYCGEEFQRSGRGFVNGRQVLFATKEDWEQRTDHLHGIHKFGECNVSRRFFRADHFRQHLRHSHAGTRKWTTMLEGACRLKG